MRAPHTTRMFAEAGEAPRVVARQLAANEDTMAALAQKLRAAPPRGVITFARGSSDHAATLARYLIETRIRVPVSHAALSIGSVYGTTPHMTDMLAIGISQSGASPDILSGLEGAKRAGALTVALVNVEDSPLAAMADVCIPLHAGPEKSVAATKSYIASLSAITQMVAHWAGDDPLRDALNGAPALLDQAWQADWSAMVEHLQAVRGLFTIGRGCGLAIAREAALKFKETCGLHAEAFSAAELRHGPMALVGPEFPLLVFRQSDETAPGIDGMIAEMRARGAPVLVAGETPPGTGAVALPSPAGHPVIEAMGQIQAFYRAANALSLRRGFEPDTPPHLAKVTETV